MPRKAKARVGRKFKRHKPAPSSIDNQASMPVPPVGSNHDDAGRPEQLRDYLHTKEPLFDKSKERLHDDAEEQSRNLRELDHHLHTNEPLFDKSKERLHKRLGVAMMFYHQFSAPENSDDWPDGMCSVLKKAFGYSSGTSIRPILDDVIYYKKNGLEYNPKHKYSKGS
mmetsp:Transcript_16510/g.24362  ORF Transcript_16510/g.24362 Transcript_16510/m.24362 type:complete len:168 (-) Transcript_16510:118-621(-)